MNYMNTSFLSLTPAAKTSPVCSSLREFFANFAPFLTRHLVRHSTKCEGGSSKSEGWFAANKGAEVGGYFVNFALFLTRHLVRHST